jgi:dTDP-4-dehydrorhamnose 3,5-epimerase
MIEGVLLKDLKIINDPRGNICHMIRCDDEMFNKFGEVYFSWVNPGYVKGWKKHLRQTQFFVVPVGNIKIVIYDDRLESSTFKEIMEIQFGVEAYRLLKVPPQVWYAFAPLYNEPAMIANCTDIPHEPDESVRKDLGSADIPYKWK